MRPTTVTGMTTARSISSTGRNRRRPVSSSGRTLDLRAALKLGIHLGLDDMRADEFYAMLILEDEREKLDREQMQNRVP